MIPDEAVDAALKAHLEHKSVRSPGNAKEAMREALAAALPYLSEAAKQPQRNSPTDWPDLPKVQS